MWKKISKNIQCSSCAKYCQKDCEIALAEYVLTHSTVQKRKIKNQFEILSIPHYIVKRSIREEKHGLSRDQYDHFTARDSSRYARTKEYSTITARWHGDELSRNSVTAIGWTEEYCQHLDSLMSFAFSCTARRAWKI